MVVIAQSPGRSYAERREVGGSKMKNLTNFLKSTCMVSVSPGSAGGMRFIHKLWSCGGDKLWRGNNQRRTVWQGPSTVPKALANGWWDCRNQESE